MGRLSAYVTTIELKAGIEDAPVKDINKSLAQSLKEALTEMHQKVGQPGQEWEAVSHSLTRIGTHLVLTVLLRLPSNTKGQ